MGDNKNYGCGRECFFQLASYCNSKQKLWNPSRPLSGTDHQINIISIIQDHINFSREQ